MNASSILLCRVLCINLVVCYFMYVRQTSSEKALCQQRSRGLCAKGEKLSLSSTNASEVNKLQGYYSTVRTYTQS
jgi:hypothetical protein